MKPIVRAASALMVLAVLTSHRAWAHSGDGTFLDHIHEAGLAKSALTSATSEVDRTILVKQMADVFPLATNSAGQRLMPEGTVCDSVEFTGSAMKVRFTFPANAPEDQFTPNWSDSVGMVLRHYFGFQYDLTAIHVEGRRDSATKSDSSYAPLSQFVPVVPIPGDAPGQDPAKLAQLEAAHDAELQRIKAKVEANIVDGDATPKNVPGQGPSAVGSQPQGVLSGRVVFVGAGHGWTYTSPSWALQRPLLLNMNEDYANQDVLTFTCYELFNAGATVVPTRPIGYQPNEVVLDNTSADMTLTGTWSTGGADTDNYGNASGNSMRFASTAVTETATATFAPTIPEAGWYPVYAFANYGSNRTSAQLYKIVHSGGESRVTINHQRVGRGWIWLGTYYFSAGKNPSSGSVVVTNELQPGAVAGLVIADAIRFGNGIGTTNRGGGISGRRSESEANIYWADKAEAPSSVSFPSAPSDSSNTPGGPARMAAYMNADTNTYNTQIYLGYHSNADGGAGTARGSEGLVTDSATVTNQTAFATLCSNTLDEQCNEEDANWEYTWGSRGPFFTGSYGEIGGGLNDEMCGTIIEVAFHNNAQDAALLRDPKVRAVVARSQTHAVIKYFNQFGGGALAFPPLQPQRLKAVNNGSGGATVTWTPVAAATPAALASQAATGYRVYRSTDGLNFGNPVVLAGNGSTTANITGLTPNQITYFRVTAVNGAGESPASEVVAVRPLVGTPTVLIVNGYDRIDRFNNISDAELLPTVVEKLRVRQNNSYDYVRQHGQAIAAAGHWFDSCSNESVINGDINLANYQIVDWISGEESSADDTFDVTERTAIQNFVAIPGKNLFVSGSEIGYELVGTAVAPTFYQNTLRAGYVSDSSGKLSALGVPGSILAGINVNFAQGPDTYNVDSADVLSTSGGSLAAMTYDNTTTTLDGLNAIGLWQAPSFSGTTTADDSTFGIVTTPTLEGSGSGRLNYNWALGTLIRERAANPNASLPTFNADSDFGIWVYGDNSGNQFRISFRDPVDGELYAKPYTTIDWTGWKLHMIPDVKNNLGTVWAAGVNNVLNGPTVQLESILMQKGASSPASGNIYFDLITVRSLTASSQTAAVQYSGTYKAVTFGFPFEAIGSQSERNQVMGAVMNFFGAPSHVADWQLY